MFVLKVYSQKVAMVFLETPIEHKIIAKLKCIYLVKMLLSCILVKMQIVQRC